MSTAPISKALLAVERTDGSLDVVYIGPVVTPTTRRRWFSRRPRVTVHQFTPAPTTTVLDHYLDAKRLGA